MEQSIQGFCGKFERIGEDTNRVMEKKRKKD